MKTRLSLAVAALALALPGAVLSNPLHVQAAAPGAASCPATSRGENEAAARVTSQQRDKETT